MTRDPWEGYGANAAGTMPLDRVIALCTPSRTELHSGLDRVLNQGEPAAGRSSEIRREMLCNQ